MNNEYDRDTPQPTYDEMVAKGYEMTGEGFWIPGEDVSSVQIADQAEFVIVKLLLLQSGETIISKVTEEIYGGQYKLTDPNIISYEENSNGETVVNYKTWMPLSNTRELTISGSYVVCATDPLETLVENYLEKQNG